MVNFTFVPQKLPRARGQHLRGKRACRDCRFKKRRCCHERGETVITNLVSGEDATAYSSHLEIDTQPNQQWPNERLPNRNPPSDNASDKAIDSLSRNEGASSPEITASSCCDANDSPYVEVRTAKSEPSPRFVSDLNPEARLLEKPVFPVHAQNMSSTEKGIWVQQQQFCGSCSIPFPSVQSLASDHGRGHSLTTRLLSSETISSLSNLYFTNVHPIIPILNEHEYRQGLVDSSIPAELVYAVCLIAAKDDAAGPHLRLLQKGQVATRKFCAELHSVAKSVMLGRPGLKKLSQIRILGLLSLHHEGCDGAEQASTHIALAIHHAQTLTLQHNRPNDNDHEMKRTFWCLWTLDRLNAVTNSRPCIMADIDISVDPLTPNQSGSVAFDIWLRISMMLNNVIGLYRPVDTVSTLIGKESDDTGFEKLVTEMRGWDLSSSTLATLHIYFMATSILAFRLRSIKELPITTTARLRQQLSAIQITRYLQDPDRLNKIHPIPVVVYAASLAMSVSYQQLRYSKLVGDQEEAHRDFDTALQILQNLRQKWSSADGMVVLARRISAELAKFPNLSLLHEDRKTPRNDETGTTQQICDMSMETLDRFSTIDIADSLFGKHESMWRFEAFDLFGEVNGLPWNYLNADELPPLDDYALLE